jgi:hypothetical protein
MTWCSPNRKFTDRLHPRKLELPTPIVQTWRCISSLSTSTSTFIRSLARKQTSIGPKPATVATHKGNRICCVNWACQTSPSMNPQKLDLFDLKGVHTSVPFTQADVVGKDSSCKTTRPNCLETHGPPWIYVTFQETDVKHFLNLTHAGEHKGLKQAPHIA